MSNIVYMPIKGKVVCPNCKGYVSKFLWQLHTAITVLGTMDTHLIGDPTKDRDANYFYVCPLCETQIHGNEF